IGGPYKISAPVYTVKIRTYPTAGHNIDGPIIVSATGYVHCVNSCGQDPIITNGHLVGIGHTVVAVHHYKSIVALFPSRKTEFAVILISGSGNTIYIRIKWCSVLAPDRKIIGRIGEATRSGKGNNSVRTADISSNQ